MLLLYALRRPPPFSLCRRRPGRALFFLLSTSTPSRLPAIPFRRHPARAPRPSCSTQPPTRALWANGVRAYRAWQGSRQQRPSERPRSRTRQMSISAMHRCEGCPAPRGGNEGVINGGKPGGTFQQRANSKAPASQRGHSLRRRGERAPAKFPFLRARSALSGEKDGSAWCTPHRGYFRITLPQPLMQRILLSGIICDKMREANVMYRGRKVSSG